ncbi:hypothetical protein DIPPA_26435 [Diplonema papillatum]|nr:hypothetical protein DIPPA_26435 [Diplonema papillatum]
MNLIWKGAFFISCWFGCTQASFAADGCVKSHEVQVVSEPLLAAVRCCHDEGWCDSDIGGTCHGDAISFSQGQSVCKDRSARLCTLAELNTGFCCGTGCNYDQKSVWFDNCATSPCVHGSCTSTAKQYECACEQGYRGNNCEVAVPMKVTRAPTAGLASLTQSASSSSSSGSEMFGAHSFDVLADAADRMKGRMLNRTAELATETMEALGMKAAVEEMTGEGGMLEDLEETARDAIVDIFGPMFEKNETLQVDVDDVMGDTMEKLANFLKTCSESQVPQHREATAQSAVEDFLRNLTATIENKWNDLVASTSYSVGGGLTLPAIYKQWGFTRVNGGIAFDAGYKFPDEKAYFGIGGKLGFYMYGEEKSAQYAFIPKARMEASFKMKFYPWTPMQDWGQQRALEAQGLDGQLEVVKDLAEGIATGQFVTPFCFGLCSEDEVPHDVRRSISGRASVSTPDCGIEFRAKSELMTLGGVAYVLAGEDLRSVLDEVGIAGLGFSDVDITMGVSLNGNVLFEAVGAPSYDNGNKLSFLGSDLLLGVTVEKQPFYKRLRLTAGMSADNSGKAFRLRDIDGQFGLSVHVQLEKFTTSTSAEFKVTLPIAVCVENCEDPVKRRDIYFVGELGIEFNPTPQASGDIMAAGFWNEAFGMPFLHIGDMILGLSIDLMTMLPSRLTVGGAACLGKAFNCENRLAPYIEARGYVGLSWKTMQDNFFIAMVSELTIGGLFDVFSDFAPGLSKVKPLLGGSILESGIYPYDESKCVAGAELDMDCFAVVSLAFIDKELNFGNGNVVTIPSGVQLRGKLNLAGWEIQVYFKVDERSLIADVRMDPVAVSIGGFELLKIGERLENGHVVGGARFYMAFVALPPQAAIDISGALEIPIIGASGSVAILLNGDEFSFDASISLFWGILTSRAYASWDWGFNKFSMGLEGISFGLVKLNELSFAFDKADRRGVFKGKITVLAIASLSVEVSVGRSDDAFLLGFGVSASFLGATLTVSGSGKVRNPLSSSEWALSVSASLDLAALGDEIMKGLKAVAEFAEQAWNAVADFTKKAVAWIGDRLRDFGNAIMAGIDKAVEFLDKIFGSLHLKKLYDAAKKLLSGDFAGFFQGVGAWFKSVFTKSTVRNHKLTVIPWMKDEYNCPYVLEQWEVRTCGALFGLICDTEYHARMIRDKACLQSRARALADSEEMAEDANEVDAEAVASKRANPGYSAVLAGARIPTPRVNNKVGANFATSGGYIPSAKAEATIDVGVRALAGKGGSGFEGWETKLSVRTPVDYSTRAAFESSVRSAKRSAADQASKKVLKNQAGVSLPKAARMGARLPPGAQGRHSGVTLDLSEVDPPILGTAQPVVEACGDDDDDSFSESFADSAPKLVSSDPRCKPASVRLIMDEEFAEPPVEILETGSYVCGSEFAVLSWQAKYGADCGRLSSNVVRQIVTAVPPEIELLYAPGPATIAVGEFEQPSQNSTWVPEWHAGCSMSMSISWDDVVVSSSCGRQEVQRTWAAMLDFDYTSVDTQKCTLPPTNSYVQLLTVVNSSVAC